MELVKTRENIFHEPIYQQNIININKVIVKQSRYLVPVRFPREVLEEMISVFILDYMEYINHP